MGKAKKKDKKGKGNESKKKDTPKKEDAPKKAPKKVKVVEEEGLRGIVRLAGKDVKGQMPLNRALIKVKGIGQTTRKIVAKIIAKELKVKPDVKVGTFDDSQIEHIDKILADIQKYDVPGYLLNYRRGRDTGKDNHNIMTDLVFAERQDIESEKKLYTWRGYRHHYGQRVRGQRSRNTGRKGMSLGVVKKTLQPGKAGDKGGAAKKEAKK